ncbi:class I SAM-dependent methyltransferase [Methylomonas sp. OY6]|uniref:Class I SAM-dependent methyltransferase n=1 Tax=Methylomonas defluvii TaxID=3045149 RepID=A0ABU4UAQ3_9GAMM|nr:class I SAM-dependent methyltransferase [Methylomonas sp. OY6]MDX8126526.1 class I SAM-dependent methyltransferase [Methylomonas sp. OY6]
MKPVFDSYARYYDLLYQDKDYRAESEYIANLLSKKLPKAERLLELGCGTGAHAEQLANFGYFVHGIDLSETMLKRAANRKSKLVKHIAQRLTFECGDIRDIQTSEQYDAVIALFHVISYQTTNIDLSAVFNNAATQLHPGGLFIFDFWYGPAVLTQRPEVRVKRLEDEKIKVTRIAEPKMRINENVVEVNYSVFIESKATGQVEQLQETHEMRYLFLPELRSYLASAGFLEVSSSTWLTEQQLGTDSWAGLIVAIKL